MVVGKESMRENYQKNYKIGDFYLILHDKDQVPIKKEREKKKEKKKKKKLKKNLKNKIK